MTHHHHHCRPAHFRAGDQLVSELLASSSITASRVRLSSTNTAALAGLVTLEDLVEEIFGEIRDEYDVEAEPVVEEADGSFVFSGAADVDEIADRLHVSIEREGFETVGGFLLSHLGHVPTIGETFDIDGLHVEVVDAERRRVRKVAARALLEKNETDKYRTRAGHTLNGNSLSIAARRGNRSLLKDLARNRIVSDNRDNPPPERRGQEYPDGQAVCATRRASIARNRMNVRISIVPSTRSTKGRGWVGID